MKNELNKVPIFFNPYLQYFYSDFVTRRVFYLIYSMSSISLIISNGRLVAFWYNKYCLIIALSLEVVPYYLFVNVQSTCNANWNFSFAVEQVIWFTYKPDNFKPQVKNGIQNPIKSIHFNCLIYNVPQPINIIYIPTPFPPEKKNKTQPNSLYITQ